MTETQFHANDQFDGADRERRAKMLLQARDTRRLDPYAQQQNDRASEFEDEQQYEDGRTPSGHPQNNVFKDKEQEF